jgi:hypothetical protein
MVRVGGSLGHAIDGRNGHRFFFRVTVKVRRAR